MPQLGPLRWGTTRLLGNLGTTGGRNLNQSTMGELKKVTGRILDSGILYGNQRCFRVPIMSFLLTHIDIDYRNIDNIDTIGRDALQ